MQSNMIALTRLEHEEYHADGVIPARYLRAASATARRPVRPEPSGADAPRPAAEGAKQ